MFCVPHLTTKTSFPHDVVWQWCDNGTLLLLRTTVLPFNYVLFAPLFLTWRYFRFDSKQLLIVLGDNVPCTLLFVPVKREILFLSLLWCATTVLFVLSVRVFEYSSKMSSVSVNVHSYTFQHQLLRPSVLLLLLVEGAEDSSSSHNSFIISCFITFWWAIKTLLFHLNMLKP